MTSLSDTISNQIENAGWISTTDLLVAILSALGAFYMFTLRKQGFWIYAGAKVLSLISILVFLGVNVVTVSVVAFAAFVGGIMAIMYGVNLKYMN